MVVAAHQPNYIPWPGYFAKASGCDIFVLLDSVQFPRGASFVNRNRIKSPSGKPLWLTVPVEKKGKGLQPINAVLIKDQKNWRRKHLLSLVHAYARAPYFKDHRGFFAETYQAEWRRLLDLNRSILEYLARRAGMEAQFRLSSELGVKGKGTDLLIQICGKLGADTYLSGSAGRKYLDAEKFRAWGLTLKYQVYHPRAYPQLWGGFTPNLSVLDFLFNCGDTALRSLLGIKAHD